MRDDLFSSLNMGFTADAYNTVYSCRDLLELHELKNLVAYPQHKSCVHPRQTQLLNQVPVGLLQLLPDTPSPPPPKPATMTSESGSKNTSSIDNTFLPSQPSSVRKSHPLAPLKAVLIRRRAVSHGSGNSLRDPAELVPPNKVKGTHEYKTGNSNYHTTFLLLLYPFRLSLSLSPSGLTHSSLFLSQVTIHTRCRACMQHGGYL